MSDADRVTEEKFLQKFDAQLRLLATSLLKLPQDYALQPAEYADAVRRFELSTIGRKVSDTGQTLVHPFTETVAAIRDIKEAARTIFRCAATDSLHAVPTHCIDSWE